MRLQQQRYSLTDNLFALSDKLSLVEVEKV